MRGGGGGGSGVQKPPSHDKNFCGGGEVPLWPGWVEGWALKPCPTSMPLAATAVKPLAPRLAVADSMVATHTGEAGGALKVKISPFFDALRSF